MHLSGVGDVDGQLQLTATELRFKPAAGSLLPAAVSLVEAAMSPKHRQSNAAAFFRWL